MNFNKAFSLAEGNTTKEIVFYNNIYISSMTLIRYLNMYGNFEINAVLVASDKLLDLQKVTDQLEPVQGGIHTESAVHFNSYLGNLIVDEEQFKTKEEFIATIATFSYKFFEALLGVESKTFAYDTAQLENWITETKKIANPMDAETAQAMIDAVIEDLEVKLSQ